MPMNYAYYSGVLEEKLKTLGDRLNLPKYDENHPVEITRRNLEFEVFSIVEEAKRKAKEFGG